jgi:hypothetical protein
MANNYKVYFFLVVVLKFQKCYFVHLNILGKIKMAAMSKMAAKTDFYNFSFRSMEVNCLLLLIFFIIFLVLFFLEHVSIFLLFFNLRSYNFEFQEFLKYFLNFKKKEVLGVSGIFPSL